MDLVDRPDPTRRVVNGPLCGWTPYPGSGAYGHWRCVRGGLHFGRHRFGNYTIPRFPRVWRVRSLWRNWRADRTMHAQAIRLGMIPKPGFGYRRTLFPSRYDPTENPVRWDELASH